ncbi:MAG: hypothetical protein ACF8MF_08775 [Phycisphaerales bacterium JB052]
MHQSRAVHEPSRAHRQSTDTLLCVLVAMLMCWFAGTSQAADPDLGPFDRLASVPNEVDAAAVFENPAESLLLSPVGRSMRSLLAMGGIFTQTERAWQALGTAFDAPVDDTIRALLSKRVAVVWDGFEQGEASMQGLTNSIDTRWTLVCEVDPAYLDQIRRSMRPVKRDIVHGRPVYAIEQGRYRVALIQNASKDDPAIVLLSPRTGARLLHGVMGSIVNQEDPAGQHAAITSGREPMLRELVAQHAVQGNGSFSFAFIARTPIFRAVIGLPATPNEHGEHIVSGIVQLDTTSLKCHFASDLPIAEDVSDAPIALFESVRPGAMFAMASAKAPRISINEESMDIGFAIQSNPDRSAAEAFNLLDAPALMLLGRPTPDSNAALSILLKHPRRLPGEAAKLCDESVQSMISAYDESQAPRFDGRLPSVVRTITLHQRPGLGSDNDSGFSWPGADPRLAWVSARSSNNDLFVASMTSGDTDPAESLRSIQNAAATLDALGDQPPSGVLLRATLKPAEAVRVLGDPSLMDLALSKLVHQIDVEIKRGVDSSYRGELRLQFAKIREGANLGVE